MGSIMKYSTMALYVTLSEARFSPYSHILLLMVSINFTGTAIDQPSSTSSFVNITESP